MSESYADSRRVNLAYPLAWTLTGLIIYASLHPFQEWVIRQPLAWTWLELPWPAYNTQFDIYSNYLGYIPLGLLYCLGGLRRGSTYWSSLLQATLICTGLSYSLEVLQQALPTRVPSLLDWEMNSLGGFTGALLGLVAQRYGWIDSLRSRRNRWLVPNSSNAEVLLLTWPLGLLFPPPTPFGMGQFVARLIDSAYETLLESGLPVDQWPLIKLQWEHNSSSPSAELLSVALGLLAPIMIAYVVSPRALPRFKLMLGAFALGTMTATLATAMNFGPEHALAWVTPPVLPGLGLAFIVSCLLLWTPRRVLAGLGMVIIAGLCALVNQVPTDPYFSLSLQNWEQGRFIRFHGLAQWIGWFWPYIALLWLSRQLSRRTQTATRYPTPQRI